MKFKKIVIANWKMNPNSLSEAEEIFKGIKKRVNKFKNLKVVICSPFVYINNLKQLNKKEIISLGAQDCFNQEKGAWTSMISASMIKSVGASFVILGHSEKRLIGEDDKQINQKIKLAFKNKLKVVLCIGEKERDEEGVYFSFLENQILSALSGINRKFIKNILIVYEPIWAVGKSSRRVISDKELQEISIFIKRVLMDKFGEKDFNLIKILYGGSVSHKNVEDLIQNGGVDGFLVGRDSLDSRKFNKILDVVDKN